MLRLVRPGIVAAVLVLVGCNTPPPVPKFPVRIEDGAVWTRDDRDD